MNQIKRVIKVAAIAAWLRIAVEFIWTASIFLLAYYVLAVLGG